MADKERVLGERSWVNIGLGEILCDCKPRGKAYIADDVAHRHVMDRLEFLDFLLHPLESCGVTAHRPDKDDDALLTSTSQRVLSEEGKSGWADLVVLGRICDRFRLFTQQAHRLLDEDMLLRVGGGDRHVGVILVGGQDKHEVDFRVLAKLMTDQGGGGQVEQDGRAVVGRRLRSQRSLSLLLVYLSHSLVAIVSLDAELAAAVLEQSRRNVAEGDDFEPVVEQQQRRKVDDLARGQWSARLRSSPGIAKDSLEQLRRNRQHRLGGFVAASLVQRVRAGVARGGASG